MSSIKLAASILAAVVADLELSDGDEPDNLAALADMGEWLHRLTEQELVRRSSRRHAEEQERIIRGGTLAEVPRAKQLAKAHRDTETQAARRVRDLLRHRPWQASS